MARYRHYVNSAEPGQTLFITTTVLDFVHAFRRDTVRDAMVLAIARECKLARAALYAYAVMPHHVHLVARMHESMNVRQFMNVLKRESSRSVGELLTPEELREFDQQRGLNGHTFWQRSFRSIVIRDKSMLWQKVEYTHLNPVRAGYVDPAENYRWSSARLVLGGHWSEETGIPYDVVVDSVGPCSGDKPQACAGWIL